MFCDSSDHDYAAKATDFNIVKSSYTLKNGWTNAQGENFIQMF